MTVRTWGLKWSSRKNKKLHLWEILQTQQVPWAIPWYASTKNQKSSGNMHETFMNFEVIQLHTTQKKNSSTTMTKIRNLNHVNNILGRIRAVYLKEYQVVKSVKRNGSVKGQFVGDLFIFPGSYRPKPRPEGFRPDGLAMKQWTLHLYMQCLHFVSFHQSRRLTPIVNLTMRSHEIHTLRPLFPAMLLQKPKKI